MINKKPIGPNWFKWISGLIISLLLIKACNNELRESKIRSESIKAGTESSKVEADIPVTSYNFILTTCLGEELLKPATFTIDTKSTNWILNFNNRDSIIYTIISGNSSNPMCGLKAKDSFGDYCRICIDNKNGSVTITFDYDGKSLVYSGYYQK